MQDMVLPPFVRIGLGSLTTTATNETLRAKQPSGISAALLHRHRLSAGFKRAMLLIPVGLTYIVTTGITVTDAVVTLWKNGAAVGSATEGIATLPIVASGANEIFKPFSNYPRFTPTVDDVWSLKVTTTSTAGVVNPINLICAYRRYVGLTDGA